MSRDLAGAFVEGEELLGAVGVAAADEVGVAVDEGDVAALGLFRQDALGRRAVLGLAGVVADREVVPLDGPAGLAGVGVVARGPQAVVDRQLVLLGDDDLLAGVIDVADARGGAGGAHLAAVGGEQVVHRVAVEVRILVVGPFVRRAAHQRLVGVALGADVFGQGRVVDGLVGVGPLPVDPVFLGLSLAEGG